MGARQQVVRQVQMGESEKFCIRRQTVPSRYQTRMKGASDVFRQVHMGEAAQ